MATTKGTVSPAPQVAVASNLPTLERVGKITAKLFKGKEFGLENCIKLAGLISGYKTRPGPYGNYIAFLGTFRLVTKDKSYSSDIMVLPVVAEEAMLAGYNKIGEGKPVDVIFAIKLYRMENKA